MDYIYLSSFRFAFCFDVGALQCAIPSSYAALSSFSFLVLAPCVARCATPRDLYAKRQVDFYLWQIWVVFLRSLSQKRGHLTIL